MFLGFHRKNRRWIRECIRIELFELLTVPWEKCLQLDLKRSTFSSQLFLVKTDLNSSKQVL